MPEKDPTPPAIPALPEVDDLAQGLGLLVYNTCNRHWFSTTDARETLVAYYALVSGCLTRVTELDFHLLGEALTINGHTPGEDARYVRELREQMRRLQLSNFALQRGLSVDDLMQFVQLLGRDADDVQGADSLAASLTALGVAHVAAKTILYREVTADDVVLSKQQVDAMVGPAGVQGPAVGDADVLAELKAPGAGADSATAKALRSVADDAPRLAGLIVQAAQMQTSEDGGLAAALVTCVRRTFEALMQGDGGQTQKGRKQIQKQLRELERQLLQLIDGLKSGEQGACGQALRETVSGLDDELQVDALAVEYAKRLKAMEQTEKRLLRYIKARGIEAVRDSELAARMSEEGVDAARWQALVAQGGPAETSGGVELSPLLRRMERLADGLVAEAEGPPRQELDKAIGAVHAQVGVLVERTARKIRKITEDIHADATAAEAVDEIAKKQGLGLRMTRRKLVETLAEVVQELCQPLAVITCSIDMIQSRMLGEVSEAQMDMLKLVSESTAKLKGLVDGLHEIAGVPATMAPDRDLLRQVTGT